MSENDKTYSSSVDFDSILKKIGQCGKWQLFNFFLLWLTSAAAGLAVVVFSFTAYRPSYRCSVPYCEDQDYNFARGNLSTIIPKSSLDTNNECKWKNPVGLNIPSEPTTETCTQYLDALNDNNYEIENKSCGVGSILYDKTYITSSFSMDYEFACEKSYERQLVGASYMVGMLIGSFVLGFISDTFGRMKALMISVALVALSGFFGAFMPGAWGFAILRFFTGIGGIGLFMVTFVLAVEYVGFKYTMLIGIAIEIPFALGELLLGLEAYFIRDGVPLQLVAYTPLIILLLLWFIVPESPRWLIAKGRFSEAKDIIVKAAKMNGKNVDVERLFKKSLTNSENSLSSNSKNKATFFDLFKPNEIMLRSLNMFYQWFSVTMCYYGLTFASTSLSKNPYNNFNLSVFIEIPAYIFCLVVMDAWGRRPILSFCQLISGISCVLAGLLTGNSDLSGLQTFLATLGKFGASACFAIVYVYTAELFPTVIRNTAIGSSSTIARVGGIIAIIIGLIADYWKQGPMVIMGIVAIIAGILALLIPETVGNPLPETMEDAINIGKNSNRGFCTCICPNFKDYFKDDDYDEESNN